MGEMKYFKRQGQNNAGHKGVIEFFPEDDGTVLVSMSRENDEGLVLVRHLLTADDLKQLKECLKDI